MEGTEDKKISDGRGLLDKGNWEEAQKLFEDVANMSIATLREASGLIGWAYWKKNEKDKAAEHWRAAIDLTRFPDMSNSTALSGLALYMAPRKSPIARNYAMLSIAMIPDGEGTPDHSIRTNACGIALAQLGDLAEAERILRETMKMNEEFESSPDLKISKIGKHQRAKNGYNFSALVLIPQGKYDEAREELYNEVIPRYQAVGAISDLAAALFRVGLTYEKEEKYVDALRWYQACLYEWTIVGDDARIKQAWENVDRVREKINAKDTNTRDSTDEWTERAMARAVDQA
ncbi:MAG: tetratricopeptide repeat protein [Patescibacteria group bacterium]|nr:tetratricopeptide repeat protein [Patescibacteria group bacterium]